MRRLALLLVSLLLPLPLMAGGDVVWSGLIYASTVANPAPPPREVAAFAAKLQHIFGYNQLQLLGQHREPMDTPLEHWLLPANEVSLVVNTRRQGANYLLDLQLFQTSRSAVRTMVLLARQSPIFLKGPLYGDGQLIIVLAVE